MKKASCLLSRFIFWVVFTTGFFVFLPQSTFAADIIINEFSVSSPQWIELYNKGNSVVNISGWFIDDDSGSQKYTVPDNTSIAPSEFKVFESSLFNFNTSSADTAQLLNGSNIEDSYSYTKGPDGKSFGRKTDGVGEWVTFLTDTRGASNNSSAIVPTATDTPTSTPVPTDTPKVPTPTRTPTPQNTPTPTKTPTLVPTEKISSTPTNRILTPTQKQDVTPTRILGLSTKSAALVLMTVTPTKRLDPTVVVKGVEAERPLLPYFFIAGGMLLLLSCGILTFQPQIKQLWKNVFKK